MKRYIISHNNNREEKERNSNLWIEIQNNGVALSFKWSGDYAVSTYSYKGKTFELWNNMELGIMSEIVEY